MDAIRTHEAEAEKLTTHRRNDHSRLEFVTRMAFLANAFALASIVGMMQSLANMFGDRRRANKGAANAIRVLGEYPLGINCEIIGAEYLRSKQRPAVFVCNHQNILDLFMLGYVFPKNCAIMAKSEFFYVPFMGQFLYLANNIFINRENAKSASKTMEYVAAELKRKNMGIFMYPEGTRSNQTDNSLLPFKQGAFRLAVEGQMPIIPIVISTYGDICNMKKKIFKGGKVCVKVLPPISTAGKTQADVAEITNSTRAVMLKTLQEISPPLERLHIQSKL